MAPLQPAAAIYYPSPPPFRVPALAAAIGGGGGRPETKMKESETMGRGIDAVCVYGRGERVCLAGYRDKDETMYFHPNRHTKHLTVTPELPVENQVALLL